MKAEHTDMRFAFLAATLMAIVSNAPTTEAAGFDCRKASTNDEVAICSDPVLSAQDDLVNAAYRAAVKSYGKKIAPIARSFLSQRRECGSDSQCINSVQIKQLELFKQLASGNVVNIASSSTTVETLPYGSRAGMEVTIVSKQGLDTDDALIKVKHTRENATAFCREYLNEVTEKCISDTLKIELNTQIYAVCKLGHFGTVNGERFIFLGRADRAAIAEGWPEYIILDQKTQSRLSGDMASGYSIALMQFQAMCPQTAAQ
jgi:uncharacterized protein